MRAIVGAAAVVLTIGTAFMLVPSGAQTVLIPIGQKVDDTVPDQTDPAGDIPAPAGLPGKLGPAWNKVPAKYRAAFFTAAAKSGCAMATPQLLAGLVEVESGFKNVTSPAGARGWVQVMPNSQAEAGLTSAQVLDPNYAIPGAAKMLCQKEAATRKNPSPPLIRALAAYNGGQGLVRASGMPAEIRGYATKVIAKSTKYTYDTTPAVPTVPAAPGKAPAVVAGGSLPKNTGTIPGIVALGHALKARGIRVGEGPAPFGPVYPVHSANSFHKRGLALDLNYDGKKVSEMVYFDKLAPELVAAGYRVIWRQRGHYDHLHLDSGKPAGMLKL